MILKGSKIIISGGRGFMGQSLIPKLNGHGAIVVAPSSSECDFRRQTDVDELIDESDIVIHLAANVGSLEYNHHHPADIFHDNSIMSFNVVNSCIKHNVKKLLSIGSIRMYAPDVEVPFKESDLFSGSVMNNSAYCYAKRISLSHLEFAYQQYGLPFAYLIMTNTYGPGMRLDAKRTGIAEIIMKIAEAKIRDTPEISMHGTGNATRDFMYIDDAVDSILHFLESDNPNEVVNVGSGQEISIRWMVDTICQICGYDGKILWDASKPEGDMRCFLDISKAHSLGFAPKVSLYEGISKTVDWYYNERNNNS